MIHHKLDHLSYNIYLSNLRLNGMCCNKLSFYYKPRIFNVLFNFLLGQKVAEMHFDLPFDTLGRYSNGHFNLLTYFAIKHLI